MFFRMLIIGVFLLPCAISAEILNGDFETPDPDSVIDFLAPLDWERIPHPQSSYQGDCYAGLHANFKLPGANWEISNPFEKNLFVLLSTGGFDRRSDGEIKGSMISQEIYLYEGDTILGAYFFGTTDYMPFNDYGAVFLELAGDPEDYPGAIERFEIPDAKCDIDSIGSYRSTLDLSPETDGWVPFSYTIEEPNLVGPYFIRCEVVDFQDTIYPSYFAVDNLRICRGGQSQADLNYDCGVNLIDFSVLSEAWLTHDPNDPAFSDPNTYYDPNDYTFEGWNERCDLDKNYAVEPNDLILMSQDWLY